MINIEESLQRHGDMGMGLLHKDEMIRLLGQVSAFYLIKRLIEKFLGANYSNEEYIKCFECPTNFDLHGIKEEYARRRKIAEDLGIDVKKYPEQIPNSHEDILRIFWSK